MSQREDIFGKLFADAPNFAAVAPRDGGVPVGWVVDAINAFWKSEHCEAIRSTPCGQFLTTLLKLQEQVAPCSRPADSGCPSRGAPPVSPSWGGAFKNSDRLPNLFDFGGRTSGDPFADLDEQVRRILSEADGGAGGSPVGDVERLGGVVAIRTPKGWIVDAPERLHAKSPLLTDELWRRVIADASQLQPLTEAIAGASPDLSVCAVPGGWRLAKLRGSETLTLPLFH